MGSICAGRGHFLVSPDASVLRLMQRRRAQGFVGTADSTFSGLAALRVRYWQRGIVDHARAPYEQPVDMMRRS